MEPSAVSQSKAIIISAIITAAATILVGLLAGFRLQDRARPEVYDFSVNPGKFPFEKSPVELREGDSVEIIVPGANSIILNCGVGDTTVLGMVNHEYQPVSALPTANLCSLIGRIGLEPAPYFPIGAYTKMTINMDGVLYLGINDVIPERCSIEDCFPDNSGKILVRVIVTRK